MDEIDNFVMGMEESYGYLVGKHARDKDAISATMLIAEMCAYYKAKGQTLANVLDGLYEKYGYYKTELISIKYPGEKGMNDMRLILNGIRNTPFKTLLNKEVEYVDFLAGVNNLPKSNVLRFKNEDVNVLLRPSGTEPKLKIYLQVKTKDENLLTTTMDSLKEELDWLISV